MLIEIYILYKCIVKNNFKKFNHNLLCLSQMHLDLLSPQRAWAYNI